MIVVKMDKHSIVIKLSKREFGLVQKALDLFKSPNPEVAHSLRSFRTHWAKATYFFLNPLKVIEGGRECE